MALVDLKPLTARACASRLMGLKLHMLRQCRKGEKRGDSTLRPEHERCGGTCENTKAGSETAGLLKRRPADKLPAAV
jgi:hypothetical protein